MLRRVATAIAVVVGAVLAFAGCAMAPERFDSRLWRQLDAQEGAVYGVSRASLGGWDVELFTDELSEVAVRWDGGGAPVELDPARPGVVFFGMAELDPREFTEAVVTVDLLIHSGRAPGDDGERGWLDSRPVSVYTCYGLDVEFVGGTIWSMRRVREGAGCPNALADALGPGAVYYEPYRFDG